MDSKRKASAIKNAGVSGLNKPKRTVMVRLRQYDLVSREQRQPELLRRVRAQR